MQQTSSILHVLEGNNHAVCFLGWLTHCTYTSSLKRRHDTFQSAAMAVTSTIYPNGGNNLRTTYPTDPWNYSLWTPDKQGASWSDSARKVHQKNAEFGITDFKLQQFVKLAPPPPGLNIHIWCEVRYFTQKGKPATSLFRGNKNKKQKPSPMERN